MLEAQKKMFIQEANNIPGWEKKSKSDLIRKYCEFKAQNNKEEMNHYIAAIMCKYWGTITNYYRQPRSQRVYVEDCYDWLTTAVINITNHPYWFEDEVLKLTYVKTGEVRERKNPIYGKPNAPDIAMIKCLHSMRAGFYQSANYDKRKLNYDTASIDSLIEDKQDYILPHDDTSEEINNLAYKELIRGNFQSHKYDNAFILDAIINGDVFEKSKENGSYIFSKKRVVKYLKNLNLNYCDILGKEFNIDSNLLKEIIVKYNKSSSPKLYNIVEKTLDNLKNELSKNLEVKKC